MDLPYATPRIDAMHQAWSDAMEQVAKELEANKRRFHEALSSDTGIEGGAAPLPSKDTKPSNKEEQ